MEMRPYVTRLCAEANDGVLINMAHEHGSGGEAWFLAELDRAKLNADALIEKLKTMREQGLADAAESHAELLQDALAEKKQPDDALRVLELRAMWAEARKVKLASWPGEALDIFGAGWEEKTLVDQAGAESNVNPREGVRRLRVLRSLQPEALCFDKTWGLGVVLKLDYFNKKVQIDFERKLGHQLGLAYASQTLELVDENHILVWKRRRPKDLTELLAKNPAEIVRMSLRCFGPLTVADLQQRLSAGVVSEANWKTFWDAARKELKKDPKIVIPKSRNESIQLVEQAQSQDEAWFSTFASCRELDKCARLMEELVDRQKGEPLLKTHADIFADRLAFVVKGCGHKHLGIQARAVMAASAVGVPASAASFLHGPTLTETLRQLSAKHSRSFLKYLGTFNPDGTRDLLLRLLPTLDIGSLNEVVTYMCESGGEDAVAAFFRSGLDNRGATIETLSWLSRNLDKREVWQLAPAYPTVNMMIDVLEDEFNGDKLKAQNQLRERFSKPEWLRETFAEMDPDQRSKAFLRLKESKGWPTLDKQSVLAQLIKIYPELEQLMVAKQMATVRTLLTSVRSHREKQEQLQHIVNVELPQISRDIAVARAHGDLRENFEFKAAKENQLVTLHRRDALHMMLQQVKPTDFSEYAPTVAGLAATVGIKYENGRTETYHILGEWDSDTGRGIISCTSKMAMAIEGKKLGDLVTVPTESGETTVEILSVKPLSDEIRQWVKGD